MSSSSPPIAEKLLRARSLDGEEWDMRVCVWPPTPAELAPWACHVEITRLFSPPKLIYGEDSWQALALSMKFAASEVRNFLEGGGTLYWPEPASDGSLELFQLSDID